jgi:biotin carboxyl carrier protein
MGSVLHSRSELPDSTPRSFSLRRSIFSLTVIWLLVLTSFLFWRGTWFGRPLSEQQLDTYLHDTNPSHVQHALLQVGNRMAHNDPAVKVWYPELVQLSTAANEEIRATDAQVMGADPARPEFRQALRTMLGDESLAVRQQAALSLARFGDSAGHDVIVALLRPWIVQAPRPGRVLGLAMPGTNISSRNGVVATLDSGGKVVEVHPPFAGKIGALAVKPGETVAAGAELVTLEASGDDVWRALHALAIIGRPEDLPLVSPYTKVSVLTAERVRQQAILADKAIREKHLQDSDKH